MRENRIQLGLMVVVLALMVNVAFGAHWYVDPVNGADSNGGTSSADAWKTLKHATSETNYTGTQENPCIMHLAAGVYSPSSNGEKFPVVFSHAGVPEGYGDLRGSGADAAIIDAEGKYRVLEVTLDYGTVCDLSITGGDHSIDMGGGIYAYAEHTMYIERCNIHDNNHGAGIRTKTGNWGTFRITDCQIVRNNDHGSGGGMNLGYNNDLTMTNCLIADNTIPDASNHGGGIGSQAYNYITLINCTVVWNHKQGLNIDISEHGRVRLYNCVFWGNDDDLDVTGTDLTITHCNIADGDGLGENGNISQDPLFVTGSHGDYYLSHAGVNSK